MIEPRLGSASGEFFHRFRMLTSTSKAEHTVSCEQPSQQRPMAPSDPMVAVQVLILHKYLQICTRPPRMP